MAAVGTVLAVELDRPVFDGIASIIIAGILGITALILARESKALLIGLPASADTLDAIIALTVKEPAVKSVNGSFMVHLASSQILVALSIEFARDAPLEMVENCVQGIERHLRAWHPGIVAVFIRPETADGYARVKARRFGSLRSNIA